MVALHDAYNILFPCLLIIDLLTSVACFVVFINALPLINKKKACKK